MTRTFTIKDDQTPTQEQLEEVRAAAEREIQFDEDSPELSPAMYKSVQMFRSAAQQKKEECVEIKIGRR